MNLYGFMEPFLGSTDKFCRAIVTHLFCPHFIGKPDEKSMPI